MQWILIIGGSVAIFFFLTAWVIYVAPAIAAGYLWFLLCKSIFQPKNGSAGMIFSMLSALGVFALTLWLIVADLPLAKKYFG